MADDLKKKGPADASRVNVNETWEVQYWCGQLDCSESELREAVREVGTSVAAVREYLNKKK